ncbi:type II secretion system protein GspM [Methylophilus sp. DW102]|uniref:type II secretion system protein GspM n=1 Tax=Methylophilus sp. DW102 TaxID=3095607 RepID=UPI003088371D|nr:type II secretion system protein GspM [Methylophilus sp. DW102]
MRSEKLQAISDKWQAFSMRERWMLFGTGLFAVVGLMDTFLLEPQRVQLASTQQEILKIQNDTTTLTEQLTKIAAQAAPQPATQALQHEIEETRQKMASQTEELLKVSAFMVSPQAMVDMLKKLLEKHTDVQVIEIQSLPVVDFIETQRKRLQAQTASGADSTAASDEVWKNVPHVYQHAVKVHLKGQYFALMAYSKSLKAIGRKLAWENAELKGGYPESELIFQVYTLSGENAWLGI